MKKAGAGEFGASLFLSAGLVTPKFMVWIEAAASRLLRLSFHHTAYKLPKPGE